jgi:hypothetical protein
MTATRTEGPAQQAHLRYLFTVHTLQQHEIPATVDTSRTPAAITVPIPNTGGHLALTGHGPGLCIEAWTVTRETPGIEPVTVYDSRPTGGDAAGRGRLLPLLDAVADAWRQALLAADPGF